MSFGVLLFELMTFGQLPYVDGDPTDMKDYLLQRNIMSKPPECPDDVYQLMTQCWKFAPEDRPSFTVLKSALATMLESLVHDDSYLNLESEMTEDIS